MSRAAKYAVPAVALAFFLVLAAFLVLPQLFPTGPPPSAVGRWSADGTRLELAEDGRLGPSVIPAAACPDAAAATRADELWEVAAGTWSESRDPDAKYQVTVRFEQPSTCVLRLSNEIDGRKRTLSTGTSRARWTLVRG
ncbi:hypothetical protein ACIQ9P_24745 [Kitasatospora sp. NPDC094019]|uniref:hypothetical protein n=1 Tax=Kitasatospora sp. NPDC094019 TaxID=3364091 RepID=UPI0037FB80C3